MNILVISDQFKKGGLETHIASYAAALRGRHNVFVACAEYAPSGLVDDAQVFSGFHFSFYDTTGQLREDADRLCDIIRERHIDVLHVHPWFGLYAACFAAARTGVKLVMTVHGFSSLNYHANLYDQLWMEDILTGAVGHAFCVSRMGIDMLSSIHMHRTSLLPNAVDLERFSPGTCAHNRRWALVTRLDEDKFDAVEALFRALPELEIDAVDIYGDGAYMGRAQALADACPKPVQLMGHSGALHQRLREDYFGVIGLGRCAIEGLALGLPVLLAGYGKLVGVIDSALYEQAVGLNFVAENFPAADIDALNAQLRAAYADPDAYCFSDRVRRDCDVKRLANQMIRTIEAAPAGMPLYVQRLYESITALPDDTPVHDSPAVASLLRETLLGQTQNLYLKDQLLTHARLEQALGGAVYDLRTELGAIDQRLYATRVEMHAADQAQIKQAQEDVEALRQQNDALAAETAALREQLDRAQREIDALTARLNTTTLGYLVRQTARHKVLEPLKHFKRLRG